MSRVNRTAARKLLVEQKRRLAEFRKFAAVVRTASAFADENDRNRAGARRSALNVSEAAEPGG